MDINEIKPRTEYFADINGIFYRVRTCKNHISNTGNVKCVIVGNPVGKLGGLHALSADAIYESIDERYAEEANSRMDFFKMENRIRRERKQREREELECRAREKELEAFEEKQKAFAYYGITEDSKSEIIKRFVDAMKIPTFEEFKQRIFDKIKEVGITDTKEYLVDEVFDGDPELLELVHYDISLVDMLSDINASYDIWGNYQFSLMDDLEFTLDELVREKNPYISILDLEDEFSDRLAYLNVPDEKDLVLINEKYWDLLEKDCTDELKELILSLAKE